MTDENYRKIEELILNFAESDNNWNNLQNKSSEYNRLWNVAVGMLDADDNKEYCQTEGWLVSLYNEDENEFREMVPTKIEKELLELGTFQDIVEVYKNLQSTTFAECVENYKKVKELVENTLIPEAHALEETKYKEFWDSQVYLY